MAPTQNVIYDGPHDAVEVPAADVVAERGIAIEVDADVANALLEQKCWKSAPAPSASSKSKGGS